MRPRAPALVAAATLVAALGGCGGVESVQRRTCESLLPVVEPAGARITILGVEPDPRRAGNVRVRYRAERPDPDGGAPDVAEAAVACAFAGAGFAAGKAELIGVETPDGVLPDIRLEMLKRFWLGDPVAVADAMRAVERAPEARDRGLVRVGAETGFLLQQLVNAAAPSALYALVALAYALIYGLIGRINLAFGELVMLGAYGAVIGVAAAASVGVAAVGLVLPLALLVAVAVTAGWSAALGEHVFRPLVGRGAQPVLVATVGAALVLQEFVARAQGVKERWLPPILAEPHVIADGGFTVVATTMQGLVAAAAAVLTAATIAAMRRSRFGRAWRAVADDAGMAALAGIDPDRVLVRAFALAGALAAIAGTIVAVHYGGTGFAMGTMIGLKALVAAVLGGIGSLAGAALGGLAIGVAEALWSGYAPIVWRDAVILALLAAILVLKPEGLFGSRAAPEERRDRF